MEPLLYATDSLKQLYELGYHFNTAFFGARILPQTPSSFVVACYGSKGVGKTSLLTPVRRRLAPFLDNADDRNVDARHPHMHFDFLYVPLLVYFHQVFQPLRKLNMVDYTGIPGVRLFEHPPMEHLQDARLTVVFGQNTPHSQRYLSALSDFLGPSPTNQTGAGAAARATLLAQIKQVQAAVAQVRGADRRIVSIAAPEPMPATPSGRVLETPTEAQKLVAYMSAHGHNEFKPLATLDRS